MKIPIFISCFDCMFEENPEQKDYFELTELRDDGFYIIKCPFGHEKRIKVESPKFEILFDMGVKALADGYLREAVVNMAASLERFHEYYVRLIALRNNVGADDLSLAWKSLSRQTERQLGAFLFSYLHENLKPAPELTNSQTSFRNEVVHKGIFPTESKVLEFGEAVIAIISSVQQSLSEKYSAEELKRIKQFAEYCEFRESYLLKNPITASLSIEHVGCTTVANKMKSDGSDLTAVVEQIRNQLFIPLELVHFGRYSTYLPPETNQ